MFPPGTDQENQKRSSFSLTQIHQETVVKILNIHGNTRYTMRQEDVNIVNGFLTAQFRQAALPSALSSNSAGRDLAKLSILSNI